MTVSRRTLLGAALSGGAVAAVGLPAAHAATIGPNPPLEAPRLLVDPRAPRGFLDGACIALRALGLGGIAVVEPPSDAALTESIAWLTARRGRRIIAMVGDSQAILMQQMAPAGRVRWLSLAQHGSSSEAAFANRHRVTALPANRGLARRLAVELAAAGADFAVFDQPLGGGGTAPGAAVPGFISHRDEDGLLHLAGLSAAEGCTGLDRPTTGLAPYASCATTAATGLGWERALGEALALIAADRWPQQAAEAQQIFAGRGRRTAAAAAALTSFVIAS